MEEREDRGAKGSYAYSFQEELLPTPEKNITAIPNRFSFPALE